MPKGKAADVVLWLLLALFAAVLLLPDGFPRIFASPAAVPAVILLPLCFVLIHGATRYGIGGILVFLALCFVVSNIMENIGVATGFPFGDYHYTDVLGPKLFLVPLLIAPSYAGMGYVSWVLATLLVGSDKHSDPLAAISVPVVGTFIMVGWDVCLDPNASTISHQWIWEHGGGYFGVPFVNYLGWYLTVYIFLQLFAVYLAVRRRPASPVPASYWLQADVLLFIWSLDFLASYYGYPSEQIPDAAGRVWRTGDINATAAIVSLYTLMFVAVLGFLLILRRERDIRATS